MNKDQVKGTVKKAEGKIREQAGKVLDNETMEAKGKIKHEEGRIQKGYGDVKEEMKK